MAIIEPTSYTLTIPASYMGREFVHKAFDELVRGTGKKTETMKYEPDNSLYRW